MSRKVLYMFLGLLLLCVMFPLHGSAEKVSSEDVDWGLVLEAEDVTPTGMVVVVHQYSSNHPGYFGFGSYYHLEVWKNNRWEKVPYIDDEVAWTMLLHGYAGNHTYRWEKNWQSIYGTLSPGRYRYVKEFTKFHDNDGGTDADFYAEFIISNPHTCQVNNSRKTCTICGKLDPNFTGLRKLGNHWFYYKSGKMTTDVTSLVKYNGEWWYVVKGKVAADTTGLVKWGGEWWYVVKGKVASKTTTLVKWSNEWWYVNKGKVASKTTTLVKWSNEWWYVKDGKVSTGTAGLVRYNNEWWYVVKGKVAAKTTTLMKHNGIWYYVVNGKIASRTSTFVLHCGQRYYVKNGIVMIGTYGKVTLYNNNYYVNNGILTTCYTKGHHWVAASCTQPQHCALCVLTLDTPLTEHNWTKNACGTFCSICGAVKGTTGSHSYRNHICTICGCVELGYGNWTAYRLSGEVLTVIRVAFNGNNQGSAGFREYRELASMDSLQLPGYGGTIISYNGKAYIETAGLGDECHYKINGDTIPFYAGAPDSGESGQLTFIRSAVNRLTATNVSDFDWASITEKLIFAYEP